MRRRFSFWGVVLFTSAVILLPAVHSVALGACCPPGQACNGEEQADRDPHPEEPRHHDSPTCLVCKISATALLVPSPVDVLHSPYTASDMASPPGPTPLPIILPGSRWARAPPR
jgi:hypothetical protein